MSRRIAWVALIALSLSACRTDTKVDTTNYAQPGKKQQLIPPERKLYMGTPQVQTEIRDQLSRIPSSNAGERIQIQWRLARYGEPAVAPLSEATSHPTPAVRSAAAFALGKIGDPRALDDLAARLGDPDESVRFEVATAMLRMKDMRGLDTMLYGLEHSDPRIRARSILVLQEVTGQTRGYRADDPPVDRSAAVARWRAWAQNQNRGW